MCGEKNNDYFYIDWIFMAYYWKRKKNKNKGLKEISPEMVTLRGEFLDIISKERRNIIKENVKYVPDYVKAFDFAELSFEEVKSKIERTSLEDLFYRAIKGNPNAKGINSTLANKSYMWKEGKSAISAGAQYITSKYPSAARYREISRNGFEKDFHEFYVKLLPAIREEARLCFDNSIYQNRVYLSMEHELLEEDRMFQGMITDRIPDRIPDLYPLARKMKRHFILHTGPTNSGKTYDALEALKSAKKGIYLAPLRLLAFEIYDRLNEAGVKCNMITGEEEIIIEDANHYSATIETASTYEIYDVAVIDEGQMIGEEQRGGAWTRAILGVCADEIHICSDESCVELITAIIEECGDTWEIKKNERAVPLVFDKERFVFPKSVQEKDALIVFSKQSVIAVAAELQRNGIKASMIYGNLPYDVRMNEVRRFIEGETNVVVATDAIGMGLNLPIRRIVFLETRKFDGHTRRPLNVSEIKQIAGRAGRRGLFETGYYTSEYREKAIKRAVEGSVETISFARMGIPENIIYLDMPLSEILKRWSDVEFSNLYEKADLEEDISLCKKLEKVVSDKKLIYDFIMIGFRTSKSFLTELLLRFAVIEEAGGADMLSKINDVVDANLVPFDDELDKMSMEELEDLYLTYDLIYAYLRKFDHRERLGDIVELKRDCSGRIIDILRTQQLEGRKCHCCGKSLPWNYPYVKCEDCFMSE